MTTPAGDPAGSAANGGALRRIVGALGHLVKVPRLRVLFVANCVLGMAVSFVLPFMSVFCTREVGMPLPLFGVFMTANAIAGIAVGTFLSHRSDTHVSRRAVLLSGSLAGAIGYLGYAFIREPWLLFVIGGGVLGVASLTFSQLFAHARELIERSGSQKADAPLLMNAFRMAFALSWTIGPALAAFVLERLSFRGLFVGASLLYLAVFALVFSFVNEEPARVPSPTGSRAGEVFAGGTFAFGFWRSR